MMENRPDRENLKTFLAHGKRVNFGKSYIEVTWHEGWIAKWRVTKTEEGNQAPLEKEGKGGNL